MGVYTDRSRWHRDTDVALMIADNPIVITRSRKTLADPMRAPSVATAGPYTGRIEPFRQTSAPVNFDEKGTVSVGRFIFLGLNRPDLGLTLPPTQLDGKPTFAVEDLLTDTSGVIYRVTSPPRWDDNQVELVLELRG